MLEPGKTRDVLSKGGAFFNFSPKSAGRAPAVEPATQSYSRLLTHPGGRFFPEFFPIDYSQRGPYN